MPYWTFACLLLVPTLLGLAWHLWAQIHEPMPHSPEAQLSATVWLVGCLLLLASMAMSLLS